MDQKLKRVIMTRPGVGKEGRNINLISNHFHVRFTGTDTVFYNYSVTHSSSVTLIVFLLSFIFCLLLIVKFVSRIYGYDSALVLYIYAPPI